MPPLDLVQLRYFQAIAHGQSITAAARELGVSQPTLSVALKRLERSLGTSLLHRERGGVRLTRTGQELLGHARDLLLSAKHAEEAVRGLETGDAADLVLACPDALG
ncbi:MAG TPA: LysR family transcriptional regulator, partial [Myxococcales bacterium]|nr:LysR family transcriptional regulator [Myxococcales bacterium]